MATTDTKPGFRLPWSSDRSDGGNSADAAPEPASDGSSTPVQEIETPDMIDAAPAAPDHVAAVETPAASEPGSAPVHAATPAVAPAPIRKPNKFMADLTKAMQAAAETAREDTLARFNAEAKTYIEGIHATSANEATDLRKQADDDVAGIRDWSKAEIARIREEADERIAHRKTTLEHEIEEHAAAIEARIERVQARVGAFETEMSAFFERLLAEDDPTRFASMAESLPEPPPFDGPAPEREPAWYATPLAATSEVAEPVAMTEAVASQPVDAADASPADPEPGTPVAGAHVADAPVAAAPDTAAPVEDSGDLFSITASDDEASADDPRISMLGLTPDFAAAEAEAASYTPAEDGSDEAVPEIGDDAIAARLAGLVPEGDATAHVVTTRVIVTGLISVASIAGFKRQLSQATGVHSVGVSSGPDGEFVFAVGHTSDLALGDVIPTLPGFGARVTAQTDGELTVAARDPEAEG